MARTATFELEKIELRLTGGPVAGVDEAGRGPWAGPVVAAAVILDQDRIPDGIADSKALSEDERERLYERIMATATVGVASADVHRIDRDNILNATMWAMSEAVRNLAATPAAILVDGNRSPEFGCRCKCIVKGDARCLSIAAASIIAKVTRDRVMRKLALTYPQFGFDRHKGYGTPEHKSALERHGVTDHHRKSFRPVQLALDIA